MTREDSEHDIELLTIQDGFNSQHSHPTSHEHSPERHLDEPPPYTPSPNAPPIPPHPTHLRPDNTTTTAPDILPTYTAANPPPGLPPPIYKARICGLQRRTFFLLVFAVPAVILIIVAGTLGKVLIHDNNNNSGNVNSTPANSSASQNSSSVPQQTVSDGSHAFNLLGCYTDDMYDRTFQDLRGFTEVLPWSYSQCATICGVYTYFGAENSGTCYCGNHLASSTVSVDMSKCNPSCPGGFCGGSGYMIVYQNTQTR